METYIELKGMKFYAYHGVLPQEQKVGNLFTVDLTLGVPLEVAMKSDRLEDTINYAEVYQTINQEMQQHCDLLEKLAGNILNTLHKKFENIKSIELKISKPRPPMGADIDSVSIIVKTFF